ncbi:proline-specific peptidase [Mycena alexandri]|uniref:Proline-specific peptidase n=1 Tax=Mycena alexandri TaxID=1745969 RepID=A0AAD6T5Y4_9AGAR|nr:proline-specific peptidase [Mycena alexandri]
MAEHSGQIAYRVGGEEFYTAYRVFGDLKSGDCPLIALHGGPGVPHQYLLPISELAVSRRVPVILYDQIGCGLSSHLPDKPKEFWTVELFMVELDNVLAHFSITDFDLYGHSWGGMLAANYAISRAPNGLRHLIISNSPASMALWEEGNATLLAAFPKDFQAMLKKHEDAGTTESEEYQNGIQQFYDKHLCTVKPWPDALVKSFEALAADSTVYSTMNGPSEFTVTGTLKTWTVIEDLHKIDVPTLLINGRFDEAQDVSVRPFFQKIPRVKWVQFAESSHMPLVEENERYLQVIGDFLAM